MAMLFLCSGNAKFLSNVWIWTYISCCCIILRFHIPAVVLIPNAIPCSPAKLFKYQPFINRSSQAFKKLLRLKSEIDGLFSSALSLTCSNFTFSTTAHPRPSRSSSNRRARLMVCLPALLPLQHRVPRCVDTKMPRQRMAHGEEFLFRVCA